MSDIFQDYLEQLTPIYGQREAQSIRRLVFAHQLETGNKGWANQVRIPAETASILQQQLERLITGEPVQYVLGQADFFGLTLAVDPSVLIPRPETEELVDWILKDMGEQPVRILDIGTGSGCIALALKAHMPQAEISGIDISPDAVNVATRNASSLGLAVNFHCRDLMHELSDKTGKRYDIIVSNPPYIARSEQESLPENVRHFEPEIALFVNDPLHFYDQLADLSLVKLEAGGRLYLEIHEQFGGQVVGLLHGKGFKAVALQQDIHGKDRMIKAHL